MNDTEDDVYRALQQNLDKLPISYPATESGVEIRILKHVFSPVQALIGSKLDFMPMPLQVIYDRLKEENLTFEEVAEHPVHIYQWAHIVIVSESYECHFNLLFKILVSLFFGFVHK